MARTKKVVNEVTEVGQKGQPVYVEPTIEITETTLESDNFSVIAREFYNELEKLRVEKDMYPESKALVANAGAYMTKAIKTIEAIKAIVSKK